MRENKRIKTLKNKMMLLITTLVLVTNIAVGISSYFTAKSELDKSGKIILENGVKMVKEAIKLKNVEVEKGLISIEEAQEQIKQYILGPKDKDGFRPINKNINLGENGYFFIMDENGVELAHPSIEGQETWHIKDMSGSDFYVTREIIKKAKEGGGFTSYYWTLPYSEKIEKKIGYSEIDEHWGWVVASSIYSKDFNKGAGNILNIFYISLTITFVGGFIISLIFSDHIIKPITKLKEAMLQVNLGNMDLALVERSNNDELAILIDSFKMMLNRLKKEIEFSESTQKKMEEVNSNLETLVHERTLELTERNAELKKLNEELEDSMDKLRSTQHQLINSEKMAALGSLVAGVAHEINTPLGVSVTAVSHIEKLNHDNIELLMSGKMTKTDLKKFIMKLNESIDIVNHNLNRASELIKSFKEVAVDQASEELVEFNICDYLNKVLLSLKHEYKRTKHKIKVNCSASLNIKSYPGAYSQIFTNLIMNSLIHGFEDIKEGSIDINIYKDNSNLLIKYKDDGKGIPENLIEKIFEPFYTTKRNEGGSGLGLNIIHNLVTQKLNGDIKCTSNLNEGIYFEIKIPLKEIWED